MLLTLGLGILVLGLANGLLFVEKKNNYKNGNPWLTKPDGFEDSTYDGNDLNNSDDAACRIIKLNGNRDGNGDKNSYYLERRMELVNVRLTKLENFVAGHSNGNSANLELYKRMEKLAEFKRNAEIEIRALRDYLEEKDGAFRKKMEKQDKELDKRIHSLVFNNKKAR